MGKYIFDKEQLYNSIKESTFLLPDILTVRASESSDPQEVEYPVVVPGGLLGVLSIWLSTSNAYGLQIDYSKFALSLMELTHQKIAASPQYLKMLQEQRGNLKIPVEQLNFLDSYTHPLMQINTHFEGGIFMVKGRSGLKPTLHVTSGTGTFSVFVYVFHQSQLNTLNRVLAKQCIENDVVSLFEGQDEEYLYEIVSDTADEFFYESIRYFCKDLPLYLLEYKDDGGIESTEQGLI